MSPRVLKWPVPVDDRPHNIGNGDVLHVASQGEHGTVHVWTLEYGEPEVTRPVRVFGTGNPLPGSVEEHIGSALAGPFVWHVFRVHKGADQ